MCIRDSLLSVADAVRLINGAAAGEFDWPQFWKIAAEDDLHSFARQSLWAMFDDLDWSVDCGVARPKRRAKWCAELGHPKGPLPAGVVQLSRGSQLRPRHIRDVVRWYLPSAALLTARDDAGHESGWRRSVSVARKWIDTRLRK